MTTTKIWLDINDLLLIEAQINIIKRRKEILKNRPNDITLQNSIDQAQKNLIRFLRDVLQKSEGEK